jgi:SAM-dependent methyltransferase
MTFRNAYADPRRADSYAQLTFEGTYALAFRDMPAILEPHARGSTALDFGCGAGRSTRFLRALGFDATGIDVSADMIARARALDPHGRYLQIRDGDFSGLPAAAFDVVLAAFPFDNIPGVEHRVRLLRGLGDLLAPAGTFVLLASAPELYTREWASFTTAPFPENGGAGSGDVVRIIITDGHDGRPIEDFLWRDEDYLAQFEAAGLRVLETHRPLATGHEPCAWVNETRVPPWVIYVLAELRTGPVSAT